MDRRKCHYIVEEKETNLRMYNKNSKTAIA